MRLFFLIALVCALSLSSQAQERKGDEELQEIAARIRSIKTYAYDAEIRAVFPNGETDRMDTKLCMDGTGKRIFYKTGYQMYLLTPQWAYQADHNKGTVGVFRVSAYNARHRNMPSLDSYFKNGLAEVFVDSVLLRTAVVKSVKKDKHLVTLNIGFLKTPYLREMTIVYDRRKQLPVEIRMHTFFADSRFPAEGGKVKGTSYKIVCRNYTELVSADVFDTQKYFVIKEGKVVLSDFKKYKLTTVL